MRIWKVFSLLLTCVLILGDCWAEMRFFAGTLTAQTSRPIVSPIWENVCMPPPSVRSYDSTRVRGRTERACIMFNSCHTFHFTPSLKILMVPTKLNFVSLNYPHFKSCLVATDGSYQEDRSQVHWRQGTSSPACSMWAPPWAHRGGKVEGWVGWGDCC
jgi:hypothetical protein